MIIFHIGYPKSASTFLQKKVLNKLDNAIYLGPNNHSNKGQNNNSGIKGYYEKDPDLKAFYHALIFETNDLESKEKLATLFPRIETKYDSNNKTLIFSSEFILSARFSDISIEKRLSRLKELALSSTVPIKILVMVRSQVSVLKSLYRDHPVTLSDSQGRKAISFKEFIEGEGLSIHMPTLKYNIIIKKLNVFFESNNVFIIPVEFMKNKPLKVVHTLTNLFKENDSEFFNELLNQPFENKGPTLAQNVYRRLREKFRWIKKILPLYIVKLMDNTFTSTLSKIGKSEKIGINDDLKSLFIDYYNESNTELETLLNDGLFDLNYPMLIKSNQGNDIENI